MKVWLFYIFVYLSLLKTPTVIFFKQTVPLFFIFSTPGNIDFIIKRSMLAKSKLAIIVKSPGGVVQYSCVKCSARYKEKEDLEKHLLVHNKEYRFLCGICGTG